MSVGGYISLGAKGLTAISYLYEKKYSKFQEIGAEINSQFTSEVVIPMVEQRTKTVN